VRHLDVDDGARLGAIDHQHAAARVLGLLPVSARLPAPVVIRWRTVRSPPCAATAREHGREGETATPHGCGFGEPPRAIKRPPRL
jgi:hypothetical protein